MELYHVVSRSIDKKKLFFDDEDHFRFIHDLFEFNDTAPANNIAYFMKRQNNDIVSRQVQPRTLLVKLHAFCAMPTHYHLLLSAVRDGGMTGFMRKLNIGYAKYYNEKYDRRGPLFEGRYKKVLVEREAHFVHLPYYIHLNPLDLKFPEWRGRNLSSVSGALAFLKEYRWSSHLDYLGKKNFPSVTQRDFLLEFFGGEPGYEKSIKGWLKDLNLNIVEEVALETI